MKILPILPFNNACKNIKIQVNSKNSSTFGTSKNTCSIMPYNYSAVDPHGSIAANCPASPLKRAQTISFKGEKSLDAEAEVIQEMAQNALNFANSLAEVSKEYYPASVSEIEDIYSVIEDELDKRCMHTSSGVNCYSVPVYKEIADEDGNLVRRYSGSSVEFFDSKGECYKTIYFKKYKTGKILNSDVFEQKISQLVTKRDGIDKIELSDGGKNNIASILSGNSDDAKKDFKLYYENGKIKKAIIGSTMQMGFVVSYPSRIYFDENEKVSKIILDDARNYAFYNPLMQCVAKTTITYKDDKVTGAEFVQSDTKNNTRQTVRFTANDGELEFDSVFYE